MTRQYSRISMTQHIRTRKIFKWTLVRKRVFIFFASTKQRLSQEPFDQLRGISHDRPNARH